MEERGRGERVGGFGQSKQALNPSTIRKIIVVGAGVAGLQAASHLMRAGFQVLVLEAHPEVGGVWRKNYSGFTLQVPWEMYQFPDFPFPKDLEPDSMYPTGEQVQKYICAYAKHFDVYKVIHFNCKVVQLLQVDLGTRLRWTAIYHDSVKDKHYQVNADFVVVSTGIYSQPFTPTYEGAEHFQGQRVHAKDFTDASSARGRHVVIVGAGKTALDCVAEVVAGKLAASVTLLYRQAHWPVPRVIGQLSIHSILFNRCVSAMLPPYYTSRGATKAFSTAMRPVKRLFWYSIERIIQRQFKLADDLKPSVPLPLDIFYGGQILDNNIDIMVQDHLFKSVRGEIHCFVQNGVVLQNGSFISADLLVFCTGYRKTYDYLPGELRSRLDIQKDGVYLYRNILPPNIPLMAFVGAEVSTFNNILTHALQAHWLVHLLSGALDVPHTSVMQEDIRQQQRWRREVMPAQRSRGSVIMLYQQDYHDQLLHDLGYNPKRKGTLAVVKELFEKYTALDYTSMFASRPHLKAMFIQEQQQLQQLQPHASEDSMTEEEQAHPNSTKALNQSSNRVPRAMQRDQNDNGSLAIRRSTEPRGIDSAEGIEADDEVPKQQLGAVAQGALPPPAPPKPFRSRSSRFGQQAGKSPVNFSAVSVDLNPKP